MDTPTIETITNNLADGYKELEPGTFQEASEVQNQRRTNVDLRNRWLYTANLPLFRILNNNLEYGLSGRQTFDAIAGADIDGFTNQILDNGVYVLTPQQIIQLKGDLSVDIVWAKASDLKLQKETDEWSYFLIDTSDLNAEKLNDSQRPFAVKAHGSLESKYDSEQELPDYGVNMNMLRTAGSIKQTKLWLPTPTHIETYLEEGAVVARASWLFDFDYGSSFDASSRSVDDRRGLCGVLKIGEADAQKIPEELQQIQTALDAGNAFRYQGILYVPVDNNAEIPQ